MYGRATVAEMEPDQSFFGADVLQEHGDSCRVSRWRTETVGPALLGNPAIEQIAHKLKCLVGSMQIGATRVDNPGGNLHSAKPFSGCAVAFKGDHGGIGFDQSPELHPATNCMNRPNIGIVFKYTGTALTRHDNVKRERRANPFQ